MKSFKDWGIKSKLMYPLLLVIIITSSIGSVIFNNIITDVTDKVLPEERTLAKIELLSLRTLNKYKAYMVSPNKEIKKKIDIISDEKSRLLNNFKLSNDHDPLKLKFINQIKAINKKIRETGSSAAALRQEQFNYMESLEEFEEKMQEITALYEKLNQRSISKTSNHYPKATVFIHQYLLELREYPVLVEEDTLDELNQIEENLHLILKIKTKSQPSAGALATKLFQEEKKLITRLVTTGRAMIDATNSFMVKHSELEDAENKILDLFTHEGEVMIKKTDAAFKKGITITAIVVLFIIIMVSLVAWYIANHIVSPITRLGKTAEEFGQGNLSARIVFEGSDEISELAISFNNMANNLEKNIKTREFAESNLISLNKTLEQKSTDLIQIADDLRISRDQANIANQTKSDFLAAMSHELRTPLNAIIGFSEIIKSETFGPVGTVQYKTYAKDINTSGQHLLALINDILDLSKVEAGLEELQEEYFEIQEIIDLVIRLTQERATLGEISLTTEISADLPLLYADQRKVKQVLMNLLTNAIKFSLKDGKVTLRTFLNNQGELVIEIEDTGIGIAKKDIEKAFSRFGQVDSGLNRKHTGTGLGLPLTKNLMELHGGTLQMKSEVGFGTTITCTLPRNRVCTSITPQPLLDIS